MTKISVDQLIRYTETLLDAGGTGLELENLCRLIQIHRQAPETTFKAEFPRYQRFLCQQFRAPDTCPGTAINLTKLGWRAAIQENQLFFRLSDTVFGGKLESVILCEAAKRHPVLFEALLRAQSFSEVFDLPALFSQLQQSVNSESVDACFLGHIFVFSKSLRSAPERWQYTNSGLFFDAGLRLFDAYCVAFLVLLQPTLKLQRFLKHYQTFETARFISDFKQSFLASKNPSLPLDLQFILMDIFEIQEMAEVPLPTRLESCLRSYLRIAEFQAQREATQTAQLMRFSRLSSEAREIICKYGFSKTLLLLENDWLREKQF